MLPSSARACDFCEISPRVPSAHSGRDVAKASVAPDRPDAFYAADDRAWRNELAHRLENYRGRKRRQAPNLAQSHLPFEESVAATLPASKPRTMAATAGASASPAAAPSAPVTSSSTSAPQLQSPVTEDFSFTIAIGRPPRKREDDTRMVIDVSLPPETGANAPTQPFSSSAFDRYGLYPVATIEERRFAAAIDAAFLFFVLGAFLALFGAIGGEFTVNKLTSAVCVATFAIVYLQYFALFTVFGGTTPGMMLRGLQVVSFSGEPPSPRQMLLRSAGYLLSAGTCFLGFLWSMWDEDTLTWHDRMSRTYLYSADTLAEPAAAGAASLR